MTVADFLKLTRRSWLTLVIFVLAGVAAGALYGLLAPRTYQSSASGFVTQQGTNVFTGSQTTINTATSYLPLITSKPVLDKIAAEANVAPATLAGRLSAQMAPSATLIEVTAAADTPRGALTLANGALSALGSVIKDVQAKAGIEDANQVTVIPMENAVAPTVPTQPNMKLSLLIGALAGIVLGYLVVFVRGALDTRVRSARELGTLAGAGTLGRIPKLSKRASASDIFTQAGEPLRQIRAGLRFASVDAPVRSVVVTSANPAEGKSTLAVALARVISEGDQRALLVDGDLRRPNIAKLLGIDGHVGLSEVLSGQVELADALRPVPGSSLLVLPAGATPPNPSEMLGSDSMRKLLETLSRDHFVIVDSPPVLPVTDALLTGSDVDGVIFVAAAKQTRKADVTAARELLAQARVRMLGVVLNKVPQRDSTDGYSYRRQYRSYYASVEAPPAEADNYSTVDDLLQPAYFRSGADEGSQDSPHRRRRTSRRRSST